MQSTVFLWTTISGLLTLCFGGFLSFKVLSMSEGNKKMTDIADAIKEGANAYLVRQYKVVAIVAVLFFFLLGYFISWIAALGFLLGAFVSALSGYIGMAVAVRANLHRSLFQRARDTGLRMVKDGRFNRVEDAGLILAG